MYITSVNGGDLSLIAFHKLQALSLLDLFSSQFLSSRSEPVKAVQLHEQAL